MHVLTMFVRLLVVSRCMSIAEAVSMSVEMPFSSLVLESSLLPVSWNLMAKLLGSCGLGPGGGHRPFLAAVFAALAGLVAPQSKYEQLLCL